MCRSAGNYLLNIIDDDSSSLQKEKVRILLVYWKICISYTLRPVYIIIIVLHD